MTLSLPVVALSFLLAVSLRPEIACGSDGSGSGQTSVSRSLQSLRAQISAVELLQVPVLLRSEIPETVTNDSAFTPAHDQWTGFDKVQHLTFSLLWVLGSQYVLVNKAGIGEHRAIPISAGTTAALGLAKEIYDWRIARHRYFSGRDLIADALGIAAGILIVLN